MTDGSILIISWLTPESYKTRIVEDYASTWRPRTKRPQHRTTEKNADIARLQDRAIARPQDLHTATRSPLFDRNDQRRVFVVEDNVDVRRLSN